MESARAIGQRLRRLRLAMGFPQKRAWVQFIGGHEPNWNSFESGNRRITVDEALKLCAKTGASLDWIYRGVEGNMPLHVVQKLAAVPADEVEQPDKQTDTRKRASR
jgi:hypothetical protein